MPVKLRFCLSATVLLLLSALVRVDAADAGTKKWSKKLYNGVSYYHLRTYVSGRGAQHVHYIKVDMNNSSLVIRPALAHGTVGKLETVGALAKRHGAIGAINATFFDTAAKHRKWPVGLIMIDGRLLNKTILYRTAVGFTAGNGVVFGVPRMEGRLIRSQGHPFIAVWGINRPRKVNEVIMYTPEYGTTTGTRLQGREIVVRQGKVIAVWTAIPSSRRTDTFCRWMGDRRPCGICRISANRSRRNSLWEKAGKGFFKP